MLKSKFKNIFQFNSFLLLLIILLFISFHSVPAYSAGQDSTRKYITIAPGAEYKAGWFHEVFFGEHWRELWTTPIKVEVLDLNAFAGGLTPYKKGGGFQTKSLRFKGNDGRIYKYRSVNKDPSKVLPIELQQSLVADVLQDQISSSNPLSAIIASPLLNAVGVLNAQPEIVYLADDEKLGEYRNEFSNLLGIIEEHPTDSDDENSFAGADKVEDTFTFLDKLEEDNENCVAATDYLKSRLMDMFMSDWDRHTDQWRWARYKKDGKKIWYPIPRDRDQAFCKLDGFLPQIAELAVPQLEGFGDHYPEIEDLTWSGRFLDRRLLTTITKAEWDSVTRFVYSHLTDEVIKNSVRQLPEEYFNIAGDYLITNLKIRRERLIEASEEYYVLVFTYVDLRGSNKAEYAEIKRLNDDEVEVSIYDLKKNRKKKDIPFLHRIFNYNETEEIRIEMLGGDDSVVVKGDVASSIQLRINGGDGKDKLIDSSGVNGILFSILPVLAIPERKTIFYDEDDNTEFIERAGTVIIQDKYPVPKDYFEKYEPAVRDWGFDWKFGPMANYETDEGVLIGGGPILYKFGYKIEPYVFRLQAYAAYATRINSYMLDLNGEIFGAIKNASIGFDIMRSELSISNFYGFGNQTQRKAYLVDRDYYKAEFEEVRLATQIKFFLLKNFTLITEANVKYTHVENLNSKRSHFGNSGNDRLIKQLNPFGIDKNSFLNLSVQAIYDTRDNIVSPLNGYVLDFKSSVNPELLRRNEEFVKLALDAKTYVPFNFITSWVLALRARGEKLFGDYPFYEAAFLGGTETLRGFDRQRFAGEASLLGNAELRFYVTKINIVVPTAIGLTAFTESGRVFIKGEHSEKWHTSVGAGVWASIINRDITFSASYAKSYEDWGVYAVYGFTF
ncbi:MAG: hypothetical protein C4539_16880 [Ignavibacteriales bacterium]|nr:MAG: hypothetical protein C4539_16880 [Ignavibacteriales bacterium]